MTPETDVWKRDRHVNQQQHLHLTEVWPYQLTFLQRAQGAQGKTLGASGEAPPPPTHCSAIGPEGTLRAPFRPIANYRALISDSAHF